MKNNKTSLAPLLIEGDTTVNDPEQKSNIFNKHFSGKATVTDPYDNPPHLDPIPGIQDLGLINTSPIEVSKIIRTGLKKSYFSNCGIPGKFLDFIATPVSKSLSTIFNNLFEEGIYPDQWKIAHVTPIYKRAGPKCEKSNFRPISLLPTLSKVCESVIHCRLLEHCISNNVISDRQAAYIKGDSTTNQLLYIVHKIRLAWGSSKIADGVFLDVSSAFEKIWHSGLIAKLDQIGIKGKLLSLFESYLSNRKQIVVIDGVKSQIMDLKAGCPQGSRLGPLLFIIYINDIQKDLESEILLFADDTTLLAVGSNPEQTSAMLNRDLLKIESWAQQWKVTFNPKKSESLLFSRKPVNTLPVIFLGNTPIARVDTHKHLGIILSSSLDWASHINYICLKASRKLHILRSVRQLSRKTMDILYKLTVRSTIDYGLHIFFHNLKQTDKKRLEQVQYRAAKLVSGALHYTSQIKLEKDLGWESMSNRADTLGLTVFYKIHYNLTRPLIRTCMTEHDNLLFNLRNNGHKRLRHPYISAKHKQSFFPYYTILWNNLPQNVRRLDLDKFKAEVKLRLTPTKTKFHNYGTKEGNKLITRLRVDRSYLNSHSFSIGHSDTPHCSCGSGHQETTKHFLFTCRLYCSERQTMLDLVGQYLPLFPKLYQTTKFDILLYGYKSHNPDYNEINKNITLAVQKYILNTKRFFKK